VYVCEVVGFLLVFLLIASVLNNEQTDKKTYNLKLPEYIIIKSEDLTVGFVVRHVLIRIS